MSFLVRLVVSIANLCVFYSYSLIGKLTVFLQLQEFNLGNLTVSRSTTPQDGSVTPRDGTTSPQLKSKVGNILVKTVS